MNTKIRYKIRKYSVQDTIYNSGQTQKSLETSQTMYKEKHLFNIKDLNVWAIS